jgi:hypothetical protein
MSIINQLASSLNRRDEVPNVELAKQVAVSKNKYAVKELIDNLSNKSKDIQNDCIKVVYEIGRLNPSLITAYTKDFIALLGNKNNRLQWGAMIALNCIVSENPKAIYSYLPKIMDASGKGSVITKDYAINILINLCSLKQYSDTIFPLLIEQLLTSPVNQLPMYAEKAMPVVNEKNKAKFIKILSSRLGDIDKETKRKRVERIIQKLSMK